LPQRAADRHPRAHASIDRNIQRRIRRSDDQIVLKLSTTTRISLTLAFMTVSLLLAADLVRLVPDVIGAELRGREALCEAVALQSSEQVVRGDVAGVETALRQIAARNKDVLSVAVRRIDGTIVTEIDGHSRNWTLPPG